MTMPSEAPPLYQVHVFPPTPHCYNICPFAIKLESYCRINKLDYEPVYTSKFGHKGTIPYLKVGDTKEVCDSNVIVDYLRERHETTDSKLTNEQRAVTHAMLRMLEEHTAQIGFYYRYGLNMDEFFSVLDVANRMFSADIATKGAMIAAAFCRLMPAATLKKSKCRGLTRHSNEELWGFSNDDLNALSVLLGSQTYFFGTTPTLLDCTVFGHLVQFLYIPIDFPQKAYLKKECINLVEFVERFRETHWPDWEQKCEPVRNTKFLDDAAGGAAKRSTWKPLLPVAGAGVVLAICYQMWFGSSRL